MVCVRKKAEKRITHSVFVGAASPTGISEVTPCWLSFKRADIRIELAWFFISFDVGFAREKKEAQATKK